LVKIGRKNRYVYEDMPTLMLTYRHSRDKYKKHGTTREAEETVADLNIM